MSSRARILCVALVVLIGAGATSFALAFPGSVACSIVGLSGFEALADGSLVQSGATDARRRQLVALRAQAQMRIASVYGATRAQPTVLFLDDMQAFWPAGRNATASTDFLPGRTCVVIGPEGQNVDVLAHELVHAEVVDRLGFRRRMTLPVWFDEGLAMQVDHRSTFDPPMDAWDSSFVRELDTAPEFFQFEGGKHVPNYAAAKREVSLWLGTDGARSLYPRLQRMRAGEDISAVVTPSAPNSQE